MMKTTHKARPHISEASKDQGKALPATSDLDHYDALTTVRDRCLGLRCAIVGATIAEEEDRNGILQLAVDLIESFDELCSTFANERSIKARVR